MKYSVSALVAALAATASAKQMQRGPFYLKIEGTENKDISGYLAAYHAGAAMEGLGYVAGDLPNQNLDSYEFFHNYTRADTVAGSNYGELVWKLPLTGANNTIEYTPFPMAATMSLSSNVITPSFGFGEVDMPVGFDSDDSLFVVTYGNDANNKPDQQPIPKSERVYQWQLCWQNVGFYYYHSLGYATSLPPHNPTCQPVTVTLEEAN